MEKRFAFVIRIWLNDSWTPTGHNACDLHGTLQSANSSTLTHFASLRQLNHLIEMALEQNEAPEDPSIA